MYFECCITANKDFIENITMKVIALNDFGLHLGKKLGTMHHNIIIRGDLTSNILVINKKERGFSNFNELELVLIEFGLAHIEFSTDDKAVDLYVLERSLLSRHAVEDENFQKILGVIRS